jgi:diguanylate cyclase
LPDTDLESARQLLIRLQRSLTTRFFTYNNERTFITFSAGIALHRAGESEESLIERADQAMLRAKRSGKNRVELAS